MIPATELSCHGNKRVWVSQNNGNVQMRLSDARKLPDDLVMQCALCERPADVLDHLAPYYQTGNRCWLHYIGEE